jgi:hypothetical protein
VGCVAMKDLEFPPLHSGSGCPAVCLPACYRQQHFYCCCCISLLVQLSVQQYYSSSFRFPMRLHVLPLAPAEARLAAWL